MAIPHLTEAQVREWTLEQKDRWWLANVFKGDMPQLTLRAALTGFVLGGLLSATNLYVGAKTGWTLGVGITSVILAFSMFRILSKIGMRDMTILENNCMQSIATAAGYMTGPLTSGMAAYMMVTNQPIPWGQILIFNIVLSLVGVLVAFPMKRRFINDEQQPFPEGRACGVVLDTLYNSDAAIGLFKAKALAIAALLAGGLKFLSAESIMQFLQVKVLRFKGFWHIPEHLDAWYYWLVSKGWAPLPKLAGVDIRQLGLTATSDLAMFGAGGLMGIKTASSMLLGMLINFTIIVPWMILIGEILPEKVNEAGEPVFSRKHVVNTWSLWWGIAIMVVASLTTLFAKPQIILSAFSGLFRSRKSNDVLAHIELPLWLSFVGVPILGGIGVWLTHQWFGVSPLLGALALLMILVLTLIAANSTALTSITPTGSLSKIPQFTFGAIEPKAPATNLMTALMCIEVASNASNLLMDIKPGYMLGAKPRQQAIGHCIGILAGALASTPLFFALFLADYQPGKNIEALMTGGQFSFPSAMQWKGVSDLVSAVFGGATQATLISPSAVHSMIIAAVVGLIFEIIRIRSSGRFPISPLAIGLGVVVTPDSTIAMFAGALFFWIMARVYGRRPESTGNKLWVDTLEPICAGLIAGAALIGITDALVRSFLLGP